MTDDLPDDLARLLRQADRVAVDTETTGLDWRSDVLQLCQFFTPELGPVLVRNKGGGGTNLLALLEDASVVKVFHHAPFDLRFLEATWGARTHSVFCTKAASKLLDPGLTPSEHSLSSLLKRHFGLGLDKGAVRVSDWGAPELSPDQMAYAAADVSSLLRLADLELERLRMRDLEIDFSAICDYMPVDAHLEVSGVPNPLTY